MTAQDLGEAATAESVATAFVETQPSWITLPSRDEELPSELQLALDGFDAGDRAAIDGKLLLLHAAATARRAAELQATSVLVVDRRRPHRGTTG